MLIIEESYDPEKAEKVQNTKLSVYPFEKLKPGLCLVQICKGNQIELTQNTKQALRRYISRKKLKKDNFLVISSESFVKVYCVR